MNTATILTRVRPANMVLTRSADYLELTKPRIVLLELIVATAAACLASPHALDLVTLVIALGGTGLIAASASIANQWWEQASDARMNRTANRPLVTGRLTNSEALGLSVLGFLAGTGLLLWQVNLLTAALGLVSWVLYVLVYTPLKTRTPLNTTVGAVSGAIPILMGWTATGTPLGLTAWALAVVVFLWQFPHFMAIAWMYRTDYATAGQQMLSVVDPTGMRAGALAVIGAAALMPVSLLPAVVPTGGSPLLFFTWTVVLGAIQLALAVRFALFRDGLSARLLLRASLIYLPAWLAMLLVVTM